MRNFGADLGGIGGAPGGGGSGAGGGFGGGRAQDRAQMHLTEEVDILGAGQVGQLDFGSTSPGGANAAADMAVADGFVFGGDASADAPHNSGDFTLQQLVQLIQFLRDKQNNTYTSGQGENGVVSDFNIEIKFEGSEWTQDLRDRFIQASEYLSSIITGDLIDSGRIDDVKIEASIVNIDGAGGILGQAGPTFVRSDGSWLPTQGIMEFDVADATDFDAMGLFIDIVAHEMMHVLGLGTIWELLGLTSGSVAGDDMRFTGENATLAYNTELAALAATDPDSLLGVPIETDGGSGTAGGHWDDELFTDELMTGYISDPNYVSSMTVAAFEDLGYETVWDATDPTAAVPQLDDIVII